MSITYLDIAGTYSGPGSYSYNVAAWPGGAVLFVNSATGLDARSRVKFQSTTSQSGVQPLQGQGPTGDPAAPLATVFGVNGALSFCKAGRGDVIVVAPGHSEALASGAAVIIPSGVTVVGGGYGGLRPVFNFTNAASFLTGGGPGIQLQNLIFDLSQVAALTKGFLINTAGFQFVLCKLIQSGAANQATDGIVLNVGADDFMFNSSEIDANAAAGAVRGISNPVLNALNRMIIVNSFLHGDFSGSIVSLLTTTSKEMLVEYNTLRQLNAVKTAIALPAGNNVTGMFSYNDMFSASAALHTDFFAAGLGTGFGYVQNFGSSGTGGMNGKSAILIPDAGAIP